MNSTNSVSCGGGIPSQYPPRFRINVAVSKGLRLGVLDDRIRYLGGTSWRFTKPSARQSTPSKATARIHETWEALSTSAFVSLAFSMAVAWMDKNPREKEKG